MFECLDSVITAVGLARHLSIMAIAVIVSVLIMLFAARAIGEFVDTHPTIKMLALSFLIMVGFTLIAEGFDVHVPKGYNQTQISNRLVNSIFSEPIEQAVSEFYFQIIF